MENLVTYLPYPKRLAAQILNLKFDHSPFSMGWVAQPKILGCGEIRNSVIVMMGAGDIVQYTDLLL
jgi:hypothetical protein